MDLEGIILSEINQAEKYKYHMISLIYRIQKTHTYTKTTTTKSQIQRTDWWLPGGRGGGVSKIGEGNFENTKTCSYKINKSGDIM